MAIVMRTCEVTVQTNHGLVFKVVVPTADTDQPDKEETDKEELSTLRQQQGGNPVATPHVRQWACGSNPLASSKR